MAICGRSLHIFTYLFFVSIWVGGEGRCVAEPTISDGINCQNGGTQLNRYTCVCPGGLFGKYCNHSMYFSFDTLENFTLTQGFEERPFKALVQGRVNSGVRVNRTLRQAIDLGFQPQVCLSHKYGCGEEGAAVSFWLKILASCRYTGCGGVITTLQAHNTSHASGFLIDAGLDELRGEYLKTDGWPFKISDWFHVVFNFNGRNKVPEYGFYYDGIRQTSETQKFEYRKFPKPRYRTLKDGRIVIGSKHSDQSWGLSSLEIDELLFFNRVLTEAEIKTLSKN